MKYKVQKQVKCKYKQALFATVATMTIGVNTLTNAAPVFAAESPINTAPFTSATNVFEIKPDGTIKILKDKLFTMDTLKAISSLGGPVLAQAYIDAHTNNKDFNNTFRTLTMGVTALIPYGGVLISPLIGVLWPENSANKDNQMKSMVNELSKMMDEKIENYDTSSLKQEAKSLMNELILFEDSINRKHRARNLGSIEETRRTKAILINSKFKDLIENCKKEEHKITELPIFTAIATAHLEFLHFIEKNGKNSKLLFDEETWNTEFVNTIPKITKSYADHITSVYEEGRNKAYIKIKEANKIDYFKAMNLWNKYKDFYYSTFDNQAFWDVADISGMKRNITGWIQEGPHSYYLEKGIKKIGWFQNGNKQYYFNPKEKKGDKQGQMKTGWFQEGDKRYFLNPQKTDEFEKGQMVTGWFKDHSEYGTLEEAATQYGPLRIYELGGITEWLYYLSPQNNTKNSIGDTFKQGQMVTGWFQVEGKWFYANPNDHQITGMKPEFNNKGRIVFSQVFFKQGQVVTNAKVSIKKTDGSIKEYLFNAKGVCINPE